MFRLGLEKLSQMPWRLPEAIKKRAIRYLLQRYVGQFLEETLSLEQLTVDLSQGTGTIKDLSLDIYALNDVAEQLNLPFKFLEGYVSEICVSIPWSALMSENCFVEITGLALTLHPKQRLDDISMVDSMIESMSSSMQIAQECLSQVDSEETKNFLGSSDFKAGAKTVDGIEQFAHAIDTVLNRIKVRFIDTVVRIEYAPSPSSFGIALEAHFKTIDYFDEAGLEKDPPPALQNDGKNNFEFQSFTSKKFHVEGISFFTEEFSKFGSTTGEHSTNTDTKKSSEPVIMGHSWESSRDHMHTSMNNVKQKIEPILFAKLSGRQEIRVRLKQNEEVSGPKVNFEANCGSLICFITPHQIYQLVELAEGIGSPEKGETQSKDQKYDSISKQKPMNKGDFKRVEHELINFSKSPDLVPCTLNSRHGWSSPPGEESEDEFYPIGGANYSERGMSSSYMSDCSDLHSSYNSAMSGSIFQSTVATNAKRGSKSGKKSKSDSCDNIITSYRIKFGSATFTILHEDILLSSHQGDNSAYLASAIDLQAKAESFFASLGPLSMNGHSLKEFADAHVKLNSLCKLSHLRIMASPFVLDGYEKIVSKKWEFLTSFSIGYFDVKECLGTSSVSGLDIGDLVKFDSFEYLNGLHTNSMKPKIYLVIKKIQGPTKSQRMSIPKIEIKATIDPCSIELDISIIDRITCLLNRKKILVNSKEEIFSPDLPPSHLDDQTILNDMIDDMFVKAESKLNIVVTSSMLELKVRFPIPDLRPVSDMNRIPWWKKNIRKDVLTLRFQDFFFETSLDQFSKGTSYEVHSRDILILFQEREENTPIPILRAMVEDGTQKGFDPARILVHCNPSKSWANLEDNFPPEEDLMTKSMMGFLEDVSKKETSLFSTRKVASQQKDSVTEVLTAPASKEEIYKFIEDCLQCVQYQIDISFPVVQILLPSKHLCEVIYNRLVSDLLLWEPSAPTPTQVPQNIHGKTGGLDIASAFISETNSLFQKFKCSPFGHLNESTCNDDSIRDSNYFSIHENKSIPKQEDTSHDSQTLIAVTVNVGKLTGILRTPYRDLNNKVLPGRHGEVIIVLEDCCLFATSGYKGNYDLTYVSTLAKRTYVYHKANNAVSTSNLGNPISTRNFSKVLYPSTHIIGLRKGVIQDNTSEGNFSFSLKMDYDVAKNSKTITFAGGLRAMTLRHFMTSSPESWLAQLGDMFNVEDYPIAGYELPEAITQLNFHLKHCQVEYQPLNLPLRAVACIDALSISSNLTISSDTSALYFIMEDAGFFLSQNVTSKDVELKDLVCVADLGVFEFCLKLIEEESKKPIQELIVSNNVLHIRTCSDSCKALLEFIIYLANDGDLVEDPLKGGASTPSDDVILNPTQTPESLCSPLLQARKDECEALRNMMQEAMIEASPPKNNNRNSNLNSKDFEMFFFPDEALKRRIVQNQNYPVTSHHVTESPLSTQSALEEALKESMIDTFYEDQNSSTDEEFCILDGYTGTGIKSPLAGPQIKQAMANAFKVKDDYFDLPVGKASNLTSTSEFPKPDLKYLLQELTVVWHIYDGNDFSPPSTKQKKVRISDKNGNHEVASNPDPIDHLLKHSAIAFSNGDSVLSNCLKSIPSAPNSPGLRNSNFNWYATGGPGRCQGTLMEVQLSKVRFLYEVYPEETELVSRHVLLIHDIEVRDRLATSKINKFLYQYSSESCPRQANANMVQIKAVTSRSDPITKSKEMNLTTSIRPIRLHVDQDALLFLCKFFEQLVSSNKNDFGEEEFPQPTSFQPAQVNVNLRNLPHFNGDDQQLLVNIEEKCYGCEKEKKSSESTLPVYIKSFCFSPQVPIKIDYHGKHIDINSQYGTLAGLIIGLGQLNNSEITLKRISNKTGILGFNKLINMLLTEWTNDIKRNQLPSILGGIGPMHSFLKLFGGVKDLIWLPIEQYHKDGRVIRGIQRGTSAFTSSSAHAFLDLSGRFVSCIQSAAETMYDMVSSGPSDRARSHKRRSNHPQDIREGVTTAFELVRTGLGDTASAIVKAAAEEHSHKGMSGAVGGVLRQIPPTVVQPIILASEATCTVIGGMKNQLVPDARKEAADKWKPH